MFEVLEDKNIIFGDLIDNTEFLRDNVLFYLYCKILFTSHNLASASYY